MYDIFTLHCVYGPLSIRSFKCEIEISMTGGKTKQLLPILKDIMIKSMSGNILYIWRCSGKNYVETLDFRV